MNTEIINHDITKPLSIIAASVVYLLDRTPLLNSFPVNIKREIGSEIQRLAIASDLKEGIEHDRAGFRYGIHTALRKLPVFSVYSKEAQDSITYDIIDICFSDAIQRSIKIDNLNDEA